MLNQAPDRREAVFPGDENQRPARIQLHHEAAVRAFRRARCLPCSGRRTAGARTAVVAADMQFDMAVLAGATGHVILAADAIRRQQHPLPGQKCRRWLARRGQMQCGDVLVEDFHGLEPRVTMSCAGCRRRPETFASDLDVADRRIEQSRKAPSLSVFFQHVVVGCTFLIWPETRRAFHSPQLPLLSRNSAEMPAAAPLPAGCRLPSTRNSWPAEGS